MYPPGRSHRYSTDNTHGTGCTLSSAIAAALALGTAPSAPGCFKKMTPLDAAVLGKAYVTKGVSSSVRIGEVRGGNKRGLRN